MQSSVTQIQNEGGEEEEEKGDIWVHNDSLTLMIIKNVMLKDN